MRLAARALGPLAGVWAEQSGVPCDAALRRAASRAALSLPALAMPGLIAAALALRWLSPLLVLGLPCRLDSLDAARAGEVLEALQTVGWPPVRGAFVLVKSLLLPVCWARRAREGT